MTDASLEKNKLAPRMPPPIAKHLRKLMPRFLPSSARNRSLVRFARNVLDYPFPDSYTFEAMCETIRDPDPAQWRAQIVAMWTLEHAELSEAQREKAVGELSVLLDYHGVSHRMQVLNLFALIGMWSLVYALGIGFAWVFLTEMFVPWQCDWNSECMRGWETGISSFSPLLWVAPVLTSFTLVSRLTRTQGTRKAAARTLGNLGHPDAIPALLRASQNPDFLRRAGQEALTKTLPTLTYRDHYGALSSDAVPNLCKLFRKTMNASARSSEHWQRVLLDALKQVGNRQAIEPLEAACRFYEDVGEQFALTLARLEEVRAVLVDRLARETAKKTLLRSANPPEEATELLRPYHETAKHNPEQLLRAMNETEA